VRDAIVQSLRAGVVPRKGLQHVQVGRAREVKALLTDIERVGDGGSALRLVIGRYGAGKTFFLHLVRSIALQKKLVTAHADLSPDRRLHATSGQARGLYQELMRNLATRSKSDGGGLPGVVERFVSSALQEAREHERRPEHVIHDRLGKLSELVGGYDFAEVVAAYWRGHDTGNEELKSSAVRWFRGEFSTKTDARKALGIRTIVTDANVYDHLKLLARFVRLAGFGGLLVCLDEMVNLYKLSSSQARRSNYEQILRIVNDSLQGTAVGLGVLMGGTPELLYDTRRGLYSYEALQTRLAQNRFVGDGLVDLSGPVVALENLSPEDLYVLLQKLRHVVAGGDTDRYVVPDDALHAFMKHCSERIGESYFRTPRNTIKAFLDLLAILEQNKGASWTDFVGKIELVEDTPDEDDPEASESEGDEDDELKTFQL